MCQHVKPQRTQRAYRVTVSNHGRRCNLPVCICLSVVIYLSLHICYYVSVCAALFVVISTSVAGNPSDAVIPRGMMSPAKRAFTGLHSLNEPYQLHSNRSGISKQHKNQSRLLCSSSRSMYGEGVVDQEALGLRSLRFVAINVQHHMDSIGAHGTLFEDTKQLEKTLQLTASHDLSTMMGPRRVCQVDYRT